MSRSPRIGILGAAEDPQVTALRIALSERGAAVMLVDSQGLNRGEPASFDGQRFSYRDQPLDEVEAWFLRHLMAPLPPSFDSDEGPVLYADWHVSYMQRRERQAFQLALLLDAQRRGVAVINPPGPAGALQLKTLQLALATELGLEIPRTLVTTDPIAARAFVDAIDEVVVKPSQGGGPCTLLDEPARARLDLLSAAPVCLQQRVRGRSVRVTCIGDRSAVAVAIDSDQVDHRLDLAYRDGSLRYQRLELPGAIEAACRGLREACGLVLTGVDFILDRDGRWVFLEANPAPVFLDVQQQTDVDLVGELAALMIAAAGGELKLSAPRSPAFVRYALPFDPDTLVS